MFADNAAWQIGVPDLTVDTPTFTLAANSPDSWSPVSGVPIGLAQDRYVAAMEIKEIVESADTPGQSGGRPIVHHGGISITGPDGRIPAGVGWPTHEVGRNADIFEPEAGKLIKAGSMISFPVVHLHANGKNIGCAADGER